MRNALRGAEIPLAILACAVLLLWACASLERVPPGYDPVYLASPVDKFGEPELRQHLGMTAEQYAATIDGDSSCVEVP